MTCQGYGNLSYSLDKGSSILLKTVNLLAPLPKIYTMKRMQFLVSFFIFFLLATFGTAQSHDHLHIDVSDIRLETLRDEDGIVQGFMLYVRKKEGMNSVLLTETTRSADGMATNYAYRAMEWNEVNGDEQRYLNGKPLVSEYAQFSIIDSTPERDPEFGEAFCLFIPPEMQYGYPWSRNGTVTVGVGTFINIRAFGALYGDYSNGYEDNPFMFDLGIPPMPPAPPVPESLTDSYNPKAATAFDLIAQETQGSITYSKGPETIVDDIIQAVEKLDPSKNADIVFALDTTGSMKDDVDKLREELIPRLEEALSEFESVRLGLLLYRDYVDGYRYRGIPVRVYSFSDDIKDFEENLSAFTIKGNEGGDVPEAVHEGLYGAMEFYPWREDVQRKVVLIGDAEPHPKPRGTKKYTQDLVISTAREKNIIIDTIVTPDGKSGADRK